MVELSDLATLLGDIINRPLHRSEFTQDMASIPGYDSMASLSFYIKVVELFDNELDINQFLECPNLASLVNLLNSTS